MLRANDIFLIPFSILWGGFAIFWEFGVYMSGGPSFFLLFGGVFVVIGLYMMVGRFFADALLRARTEYGLTTKRALIVAGLAGQTVTSFPIEKSSQVEFTSGASGAGTIKFGKSLPFGQGGMYRTTWTGVSHPFSFEKIKNAKSVYEQVRSIQNRN